MDNPYWSSTGQEHYISLESIKNLCFEICNIFEASKAMANEMAASESVDEEGATFEKFPLMKLHQEMAFKVSSELLLKLALLTRTYDDQLKSSHVADKYMKFANMNDSGHYVGVLDGKEKFFVRQACNKIIHAQEVRPIYERADKYSVNSEIDNLDEDIWYLTGEIELSGVFHGEKWGAVVYTQPFLETILGLIQFGYPEKI